MVRREDERAVSLRAAGAQAVVGDLLLELILDRMRMVETRMAN
jgi:hypothetical protein